jgi:NADH-quinone oxidoreductase subunit H
MRLGWKVLVPVSLLWLLLIFALRAFRSSGGSTAGLIIMLGIVIAVVLIIAFLVPDRKRPQEQLVELASDYPVPPLDLVVPTPARHKLRGRGVETRRSRERALTGNTIGKETE